MVWTLQSDRTNKMYDFDDDVSQEDALGYLRNVLEPETSTQQMLGAIPKLAESQLESTAAGMLRVPKVLGPLFGPLKGVAEAVQERFMEPKAQELAASSKQKAEGAFEGTAPTFWQRAGATAGASILGNLPALGMGAGVAGIAARGGAALGPALGQGLSTTLGVAAGQEGLSEFSEQLESGATPERAAVHGTISGAAEYLGERIAFSPLQKLLKTGDSGVKAAIFEFLFKDQVGEQLTTGIQWLNRKLSRQPDLTVSDLWEEMKLTAASTAISGPVQAVATGPLMTAAAESGQVVQERIEPTIKTPVPVEPSPNLPDPGEAGTPTDPLPAPYIVREKGEGRVVSEESLPIIGEEPGAREPTPRELPLDQQLELLRRSYDAMQNKTAFDTPEDRIRKRGEFQVRRKQVEENLKFDPEGRSILIESDLAMGIRVPDIQVTLEQQVNEAAVLAPEEIEQRRTIREQSSPDYSEAPVPSDSTYQALNLPENAPIRRPIFERENFAPAATQKHLAGRVVLGGNRPEFKGQSFEQVVDTLQPTDIVYFGRPGQENYSGVSYLTDLLQDLKATYLPDRAIVIGEISEQNDSYLSMAWSATPNTFAMTVPRVANRAPSSLTERVRDVFTGERSVRLRMDRETLSAVDTVLHEFQHFVHMRHWENSSAEEKQGVAQEYHADLALATRGTVGEVLRQLYSPKSSDEFLKRYISAGGSESDTFLGERAKALLPMHRQPGYWFNFNEWLAHKGVKYFTTRLGVSKKNASFFQRFLRSMQQYYRDIIVKYGNPGKGFAQWMDNVAARESGQQLAMSDEEVKALKTELIATGIQPDVADLLASVRGRDDHLIAQLKEQQRELRQAVQSMQAERKQFATLGAQMERTTTREQLLSNLSEFQIAKDLAKHPVFRGGLESKKFFLDSILSTIFNSRTIRAVPNRNGIRSWEFQGKGGTALVVMLDNRLRFVRNDYSGSAELAVKIGVASHIMRKLSDEGAIGLQTEDSVLLDYFGRVGDGRIDIPFFLHQPPIRPEVNPGQGLEARDPSFNDVQTPAWLDSLGSKLKLPWFNGAANSTARFNKFTNRALGMFQMIKLNEHIPGTLQLRDALRNGMGYRHKWLTVADRHIEQWAFGIDKTQATKLGNLLFHEAETGVFAGSIAQHPELEGHYIFRLDETQRRKHGLDEKTAELYSEIRNDFMRFADETHAVALWELARDEMSDTVHLSLAEALRKDAPIGTIQQIFDLGLANITDLHKVSRIEKQKTEINKQFTEWKQKPYMPYTRFGRFGVFVRDGKTNQTKYFEGYESESDARKFSEEMKKRFPGDAVSITYLEDAPYMLAGLPPAMVSAMKKQLDLTPAQVDSFSEILSSLSHANSFRHRQARRKDIAGYSLDAIRAYGDYFRRGSSFLARVRRAPETADAMRVLKTYINNKTKQTDGVSDVVKLGQLHEYFERQLKYLDNPGNEMGEIKSFMSLFHFAFNASTAMVNATQVPFVTLPWMAERYGMVESTKVLGEAYKDVIGFYFKGGSLSSEELAMLDFARKSGFRDQSQATTLAQIADGSALARATPISAWKRGINELNHYGMWMFSKGELLNRDVTLVAMYRKEAKQAGREGFDREAFDKAREAVELTHNEYGRENRPDFMQGPGSVIFQFMHFAQNMLFLQLGGDKAWWRLLLVQFGVSGFLGLPGGQDALQAAKFIGRQVFGKDWDVEREVREYLHEASIDPELVLRGLLSDVWGFDLSRRVSLGEVVPGAEALGSHRKFHEVLSDAVGDAGGPAVSLVLNAMKFVSQENKTEWDSLKSILPSSLRNFGNAAKAFATGKVSDRSGATLFEPDLPGVLGMSVGFMPTELNEAYRARSMQNEQAQFWTQRRQNLLNIWNHIAEDRGRDREAMADFQKRLRDFNTSAPDRGLVITADTLRRTVQSRGRANVLKEQGYGSNPSMRQAAKRISELHGR